MRYFFLVVVLGVFLLPQDGRGGGGGGGWFEILPRTTSGGIEANRNLEEPLLTHLSLWRVEIAVAAAAAAADGIEGGL